MVAISGSSSYFTPTHVKGIMGMPFLLLVFVVIILVILVIIVVLNGFVLVVAVVVVALYVYFYYFMFINKSVITNYISSTINLLKVDNIFRFDNIFICICILIDLFICDFIRFIC